MSGKCMRSGFAYNFGVMELALMWVMRVEYSQISGE